MLNNCASLDDWFAHPKNQALGITNFDRQFEDIVFPCELAENQRRRDRIRGFTRPEQKPRLDPTPPPRPNVDLELTGLALSGGGIRSASFCLGVLESLYESKLLGTIDYLSTVSGGGFIGGWLSALTKKRTIYPERGPEPSIYEISSLRDKAYKMVPRTLREVLQLLTELLAGVCGNLLGVIAMTVSGLTSTRALRHSGQRRCRATHSSRSVAPSRIRLLLVRCRTASWWRRARISSCSKACARTVDSSMASRDLKTTSMVQDSSGTGPQPQPFQSIRGFWK